MAKLGIGIVGMGRHGERYARHILEDFSDLELAGIARRNVHRARNQARDLGCRAFGSAQELIAARGVDAVVVVVPPVHHPEIVEAAASRGLPVLLEKPAAVTAEEGRTMLRKVQAAAIPVMVAQTMRYAGVVQTLLEARERLGRIHALRVSLRFEPSPPGWVHDPSLAVRGTILHTGIHSFDLVRFLSGMEGDRVMCESSAVGASPLEDNFCASVRLDGGNALAGVTGCRATASRSGPVELVGEHGQLLGDLVFNTAHFVEGKTVAPLEVPPPVATVREAIRDFVTAVAGEKPMPIPLEEGLRSLALVEACYQSSQLGQAVPVTSID
jgi:predicted dehydrogenase